MTIAGFSELSDAEPDDIEPWASHTPSTFIQLKVMGLLNSDCKGLLQKMY